MRREVEAIGTNAHELPMVYAALAENDAALAGALQGAGRLAAGLRRQPAVILPDTYGTEGFLARAGLAGGLEGARPDLKPPVSAARELIAWWRTSRVAGFSLSDAVDVDASEDCVRALRAGRSVVRLGPRPGRRFRRLRWLAWTGRFRRFAGVRWSGRLLVVRSSPTIQPRWGRRISAYRRVFKASA